MALSLPSVLPFDIHTDAANLNAAWKKWIAKFGNYLIASGITEDARQRALLLHCVGDSVHDIFLALPGNTAAKTYTAVTDLLTNHFAPNQNEDFEVFKFREAQQRDDESVDDYHVRLRALAQFCAFDKLDLELKRHLVQTCKSKKLRRAVFENQSLTLDQVLQKARLMEMSESHAATIEKSNQSNSSGSSHEVTHFLGNRPNSNRFGKQSRFPNPHPGHAASQNRPPKTTCGLCGGSYPHAGTFPCPAKGKTCRNCGKLNHFSKLCRSTSAQPVVHPSHSTKPRTKGRPQPRVNALQAPNTPEEESEFLFTLFHGSMHDPPDALPLLDVNVGGNDLTLLMDTGSSVNLLNSHIYQALPCKPTLEPSTLKIYPYGSTMPLQLQGQFTTNIKTRSNQSTGIFHVTHDHGRSSPSIIGYPTLRDLHIIATPAIFRHTVNIIEAGDIIANYPNLFQGLGQIKDVKVTLAIDDSVQPVAQPHRRIPFHLREALDAELDQLLDMDIIEPVTGHSTWVSPVVLVVKGKSASASGKSPIPNTEDVTKNPQTIKLRLCVDMRRANTAIIRVRHVMPTIEDVIHRLNGATVFSKLDLNQGYHQLVLDESSRPITTFSTHRGLYRYKRLSFGVSSAAEIFQHAIYCIIQDIPNSLNISDDILVFGITMAAHDAALDAVLRRLDDKRVTLNLAKCDLRKSELEFYGHIFGTSGVSVHRSKVKSLQAIAKPTTPDEVRSLLGLATYCSRFVPNFSDLTLPLRVLTKKDTPWVWTKAQDDSLRDLKRHLEDDTILSYFDPASATTIYVDASPTGLGALLAQTNRSSKVSIVSFASKALTDVETRYSQTEREALAVVWGCEHFHLYIYGSVFTVVTDHLPLLTLLGNPKARTSARIERWNLRLAPYHMSLKYQPGKLNPVDYLSRHPSSRDASDPPCLSLTTEAHVNMVLEHGIPRAVTYTDVKRACDCDPLVQLVVECHRNDHWQVASTVSGADQLRRFELVKGELAIVDGMILKDHRLYIPGLLQERVVAIAHEGHLGLVKTKQLLRTKVWFPKMDDLVERVIRSCIPCLAVTRSTAKEPLQMTTLPDSPWSIVAVDHLGPFKNGQYLFVLMDEHTRFPIAEIVTSTSFEANAKILTRVFSIFGLPDSIKSDNGPPFNSAAFTDYLTSLGIKHRKVTPYWPQDNGTAERFMASLNKTIRAAEISGTDWKDEIQKFLTNYRNTPHSTTGVPPSELMFGRSVRTKLPMLSRSPPTVDAKLASSDKLAKAKMKSYHDQKHNAKENHLKIGDKVLVKMARTHKLAPYFDPSPYTVKAIKGSLITAERMGHSTTRNSSHFKAVLPPTTQLESVEKSNVDLGLKPSSDIPNHASTEANELGAPVERLPGLAPGRYNLRANRVAPKRLIAEM